MTTTRLLKTLFLILCLTSADANAQRKSDIISLYNGDRVTGEIKSLYGGILEFSTDSMGTIRIEWPEISRVQSEFHYEVRLSDGERLYGSFAGDSRAGQVVLVDIFGRHELEWLQVVEIRPVEDNFWERFEAYISTTFAYTKANDVAQVTLNTQVSYEDEKSVNTFNGRTDISRTAGDEARSSRLEISRRTWRKNRSDAFRAVYANYERNDELELDHRIGVGAGLGRYFIDTHSSRVTGSAGLQVITEKTLAGNSNQDVELFIDTTLSTWKFTTPELNVDLNFSLYPSVTDSGRLRSDTNLRLRWELIEDLYWDVTAWATSDNQSNEGEGTTWDYAITTGIGWKY